MYEPNRYIKGNITYSGSKGSFIINSKYSNQTKQIRTNSNKIYT